MPLEGVVIVEQGTSSELEQSRLLAPESSTDRGNERPAESILNEMDTTAGTAKVLPKGSDGDKDGVVDSIEGNDHEDKNISTASSPEKYKSLQSVEDKDYSSVVRLITKMWRRVRFFKQR